MLRILASDEKDSKVCLDLLTQIPLIITQALAEESINKKSTNIESKRYFATAKS